MNHKFVPPAPADSCEYAIPGEGICGASVKNPIHASHIPPAILELGRVEASSLRQLNDLQREKTEALAIMFGSLPANLQHLRDGTMGNIVRYYVGEFRMLDSLRREVDRLKADNDDKNKQIGRMGQEMTVLRAALDIRKTELQEAKEYIADRLSVAETDDEAPEYADLPPQFLRLANEALDAFAEGYAEYGPNAADALGLAGQWGDLHRKVMKLKRSLWEGRGDTLTRESETDILRDIIGHCLLALDMIARDMDGGRV